MQNEQSALDLRGLRLSKGVRQRKLAGDIGISVNSLAKIERGLAPLDASIKERILEALDETEIVTLRRIESGEGYVTSRPASSFVRQRTTALSENRKYVVDLFCGVGGFSAGFDELDEFEVTAGVDLLGDRLDTFSENHPTAVSFGQDIREINSEHILEHSPKPFVVVGGPPCQGFSSLRPFRNIEWADPRNNLGEEFVRLVDELQPEWVVFENVVGLLTYKGGSFVTSLRGALEAAGYSTDARVLNAAYYGVPQRRERLIIVANRTGKEFIWPTPTHYCEHRSMAGKNSLVLKPERGLFSDETIDAVTVTEALQGLPDLKSGEKASAYPLHSNMSDFAQYIKNGAVQLTHHEATAHSPKMMEIIRHSGANINALPSGLVTSGFSSCYSRLDGNQPSVTITVNFVHPASNRCIHPHQNRALTPREGARLQGFYDTFKFSGKKAQVVKQIGNAVPPMLGKVIAMAILDSD